VRPSLDDVTRRAHRHLIQNSTNLEQLGDTAIQSCVESIAPLLSSAELASVADRVGRLLFGFGPLESLLGDPEITELMVNGPGTVWVERNGKLTLSGVEVDREMLRVIVDRIVGPLGLRVDRTAPFVDARLPDGSRVNIAVPPLAVDGPYITIRRFRARAYTLADFCKPEVQDLLVDAIRNRQSLVVSGGTGSGKTSLLNALAAHIEPGERVITIEDAAELRFPGDHTVRLEARPANAEGVGQATVRSLLRNALRMRPDRLIIGEVRGSEALDMIQAMNTGHDGSMSTCHANSPLDALRRIEAMALMGDVDLPIEVLRDHLWAAVDLIVHVQRIDGGQRQVCSIYRCEGEEGSWSVRDGERAETSSGSMLDG
jgi:pilus assembly protein CpaF